MVVVPPGSASTFTLDEAKAHADGLRLPVLLPGDPPIGMDREWALTIVHERTVGEGTSAYVLVLPEGHLVQGHAAAYTDPGVGGIVPGPAMPGQVRLAGERAEVGLPQPIVDARFAGIDSTTIPAGVTRDVDGGLIGLWRELDKLIPGQAVLVHVATTSAAAEDLLAVRAPDGIALLHSTPDARAATLPRNPGTLRVTPAVTPVQAVIPGGSATGIKHLVDRPGLMLLDPTQSAQIEAAKSFRAAEDEYPVFVHGSPAGPMLGGRLVTATQLRALIGADPRARDRKIILVQREAADSPSVLDDFAAALFAMLPREHQALYGMGGTAWVQPLPAGAAIGDLTEVLVTRMVLGPDGAIRHHAAGIRVYGDAPNAPTTGPRTAKVTEHRFALSLARKGHGIPLTDDDGAVLAPETAPTPAGLHTLDHPRGWPPEGIGTPFGWPDTYLPSQESAQHTFSEAYHRVAAERLACYESAKWLRDLATSHHNAELIATADKFIETHEYQQSDPRSTYFGWFMRLRELQQAARQTRSELVDTARELQSALRHPMADGTAADTRHAHTADSMQTHIDQIIAGEGWEDIWRRVSRDLGREIIAEARRRLWYGPSNDVRVGKKYQGAAAALAADHFHKRDYIRHTPTMTPEEEFRAAFLGTFTDDQRLNDIAQLAVQGQQWGLGPCGVFASMTLSLIWRDPRLLGIPVTLVEHVDDHVFVIIGPPAHGNTLVIDPWPYRPSSVTLGNYFLDTREAHHWTAVPDGSDLLARGRDLLHLDRMPVLPLFHEPPSKPLKFIGGLGDYWDRYHTFDPELGTANSDSEGEEEIDHEALPVPSWSLRLTNGVRAHGNIHVISSINRDVQQALIDQVTSAADGMHSVILLDAPRPGEPPLAEDIAALNYLLEQFAQRGQLPVVISRGRVDDGLLEVTERYGAVIVHPTLDRADGTGLQLDFQWKATASRPVERVAASSDVSPQITAAFLETASRLAWPTEAIGYVDDALGQLIWAADLNESRKIFDRLKQDWTPQRMRAGGAGVEQMVKRVPDQPALSVFAPVLHLGAVGHADIAFDFASATEVTRPQTLLGAVRDLIERRQFETKADDALTTEDLTKMVSAVSGKKSAAAAGAIITAVGAIKTANFEGTADLVAAASGKLSIADKQQWLKAMDYLLTTMPTNATEKNQLKEAAEALLQC
ncbi:hypothetical protein ACLQ24_28100 [Micromonospora sp. DT4]|uniref:hypothetical protein n=1 Tax=Micromonospora sp. DT4 TaxID=3393438 RepID=UPI003CECDBB9